MNTRRRLMALVVMTIVVSLPVCSRSGIGSAHTNISETHRSSSGTGDERSVRGGVTDAFIVKARPNPSVETARSDVEGVVYVVTSPSFAGDTVRVSSSQFQASCIKSVSAHNGTTVLDSEGKANVHFRGHDCAPGSSVIEADLEVAPFSTGLTTLEVKPPRR